HEIGLNSLKEEGLGTLGTRAIIVQFISLGIQPELKKEVIASITSSPTLLHAFLKNRDEKPSGPGALSLLIEKIADLSSS
ncbi:hypothetical protein KJJ93_31420, partial [Escherichia coli]|uniref:hypothetical protein n=1 Tax=Escherichia coli TaxID=562 RepID=UPI001BDB0CBA